MNTILPETPIEELDDSLSLTDLLDLTVTQKERQTLTFQNKLLIAIVPLEEVELVKKIENTIDSLNIRVASKSYAGHPDCWQV